MELKHNPTYNNYNLDLKSVKVGESFEFTLKYDTPKQGTAKKQDREYTWHLFSGTIDGKETSFFASGMTTVPGVKLPDKLLTYKAGQKVRLTKKLSTEEIRGAYRPLWEVEEVGGQAQTPPVSTPTTPPQRSSVDEELVALLKERSGGVKQPDAWLDAQLSAAEVFDESIRQQIKAAYASKW